MKKRILIVDCNANIGGIQKALVSLLKQISDSYDITLLLLYNKGALLQEIPENVRILTTKSVFRYMGMAQADCTDKKDKLSRGLFALLSKAIGRKFAVHLAKWTLHKDVQEEYDVAIAYSHMGGDRSFFAGAPEYVHYAVHAQKKICYIHCDYLNSGNQSSYSDALYKSFDSIICVSDSTRERFIQAIPELSKKTVTAKNPIDCANITRLAACNTVKYDDTFINLVSVARLTFEKGIARFIRILSRIDVSKVRYWVIGDGAERQEIEKFVADNHLEHVVNLCGEDSNPYRHIVNADLLVVPSYHEAAPVVFQEAQVLGIPVLTTRTTSAEEMVGDKYGFVVDNDDEALETALITLLIHSDRIIQKRDEMKYSAKAMHCEQKVEIMRIINELTENQK